MRRFFTTLVLLSIAGLLVHLWVVDGWLFPNEVASGSMAPRLRGPHHTITCRDCGLQFSFVAEEPTWFAAVCPNCGTAEEQALDLPAVRSDRLLVDRCSWSWSSPRRWEMAVMADPLDPRSAR